MNKNNFKFKSLVWLLIIGLIFVGCSNQSPETKDSTEITESSSEDVNTNRANFSLEYIDEAEDTKLFTDGEDREHVLVPRNKEIPAEYKDYPVIYTPVENVLYASTSTVGMLTPLDVWDSISGVTTDENLWYIPEIVDRLESEDITYVGDDYAPNRELLQSTDIDLAVVYTGVAGQNELIEALEDLEIPYVVENSYLEEEPQDKMEWLVFLGSLYNKELEAREYINTQIAALEEMEATLNGATGKNIAYGSIFDGLAYVPTEGTYVQKMIEMAGGTYSFENLDGSTGQLSLEEMVQVLDNADQFIYSGSTDYMSGYEELLEMAPVLENTKVIQDQNVWQISSDYWQRTDQIHERIIDLAAIIHPELFPNRDITYYHLMGE